MLCLSRKENERLVVAERESGRIVLSILVVDIRDDKVRLGVDAPPEWLIDREEVFERRLASRAAGRPFGSDSDGGGECGEGEVSPSQEAE